MKFIPGDVGRVQPPRPESGPRVVSAMEREDAAPMEEKAFFEYHMYTLPRPSTVADNEVKQLEMFTPVQGLKIDKRFLYNPMGQFPWSPGGRYDDRSFGVSSYKKVNVFIEFRNS